DLLEAPAADAVDQRRPVVKRIGPLTGADRVDRGIGREARIVVLRPNRWRRFKHLLSGPAEQQSDGGPGGVDAVAREKINQRGHGLTDAEQVRTIVAARAGVADAPVELEIERDHQRAGRERRHWTVHTPLDCHPEKTPPLLMTPIDVVFAPARAPEKVIARFTVKLFPDREM